MPVKKASKIQLSITAFLMILAMTSCGTHKRIVYFQGAAQDTISAQGSYSPVFKPDDIVSVIVTAENPESTASFNLPSGISQEGESGGASLQGYLVDEKGYIELPVLGEYLIGGKSRREVVKELKELYSEYLDNPVVNIQIQNFKITVLGDVGSPGIIEVSNERVTILEAIGISGDLEMTGERENVLVIRDKNGKKIEYRVDLTSKDLFNSPVYYLEQNDVIYVEPNLASRTTGTFWATSGRLFLSLISFGISMVLLITK